jgi:steroid delta-isomerase-like uncharacterized protein
MSAQDNAKFARSVYEMYNSRDLDGMAAQAAVGAEIMSVPTGMTLEGPDGFRQYIQGWASAFPDSKIEVTNVIAGEEGAVVEFRGRGTHTGPLMAPTGEIPATGKSVDIPFCDVLQIKDGKITSMHSYFDLATMMGQLGLMG